jgi:hypothetical protein
MRGGGVDDGDGDDDDDDDDGDGAAWAVTAASTRMATHRRSPVMQRG